MSPFGKKAGCPRSGPVRDPSPFGTLFGSRRELGVPVRLLDESWVSLFGPGCPCSAPLFGPDESWVSLFGPLRNLQRYHSGLRMSQRAQELVSSVWTHSNSTPFDIDAVAHNVIHHCGVDAAGLTTQDLRNLFFGLLNDRWSDVAFSFDEGLAAVLAGPIDSETFTAAVFMSLYLREAILRGSGDWDMSFDKICMLIIGNREFSTCEWRMAFFRELLRTEL